MVAIKISLFSLKVLRCADLKIRLLNHKIEVKAWRYQGIVRLHLVYRLPPLALPGYYMCGHVCTSYGLVLAHQNRPRAGGQRSESWAASGYPWSPGKKKRVALRACLAVPSYTVGYVFFFLTQLQLSFRLEHSFLCLTLIDDYNFNFTLSLQNFRFLRTWRNWEWNLMKTPSKKWP